MRSTASFALLALATGSTNAIFCFVKEQKCLPGVGVSVDYDEIPKLLGLPDPKSSTMTGTATGTATETVTETASSSSNTVVVEPTGVSTPDPLPTGVGAGFLDDLFKSPKKKMLAAPPTQPAVAVPAEAPVAAPVAAPAAAPAPEVAAAPAAIPAAVAALPAPVAAAPVAFASPSSVVPDWVRNLIPRSYAPVHEAPEYQPDTTFQPVETIVAPPAYSVSSELIETLSAYVTPVSKVVVTTTYSASQEVDVTTTVKDLTTVTPTLTVTLSESSVSKKETRSSAPPAYTTLQRETYAVVSPRPQKETHAVVQPTPSVTTTRTTTMTTTFIRPTTLSFSTVAAYTIVQKPVEVPAVKSYCPSKAKSVIYPVPSNATTVQAMTDIKPTEAKPTVYVTPIPASYSQWNASKPAMPEQYTGAATANSLNLFFVLAAGAAAMMAL